MPVDFSFETFKKIIRAYYKKHKRDLPWRNTFDPYRILVSEIMLQQTQVSRVLQKYPLFIARFPTIRSLDEAPLKTVLALWQGMGYNRRALYLKRIAQTLVKDCGGTVPRDSELLQELPGIGKATARSIAAFAFNTPTIFIETNIRRVYINFFFPQKEAVHDNDILLFVEKTLDRNNPREWYYALMDYGAHLSKITKNPNTKSRYYKKQSPFKGSDREIRGKLIQFALTQPMHREEILKQLDAPLLKILYNLNALVREGFIMEKRGKYLIRE